MSRAAKRARARFSVTLDVPGGDSVICRTRDVSETGMFLETDRPVPIGAHVEVSLFHDESGEVLSMAGVVTRLVPPRPTSPGGIGLRLQTVTPAWREILGRAQHGGGRGPRGTQELPAKRRRVLVIGDGEHRRSAMALYVTSGWDVRYASDLPSSMEALATWKVDAVVAEFDLDDGRWPEILRAARTAQPEVRRIIRSSLHGHAIPPPGRPGDLVHRVIDETAGLEAVVDAVSAEWGGDPEGRTPSPSPSGQLPSASAPTGE